MGISFLLGVYGSVPQKKNLLRAVMSPGWCKGHITRCKGVPKLQRGATHIFMEGAVYANGCVAIFMHVVHMTVSFLLQWSAYP